MCMIRKTSPKEEPKIEEPRAQEDDKWVNLEVSGMVPRESINLPLSLAIITGKNIEVLFHHANGRFKALIHAVPADKAGDKIHEITECFEFKISHKKVPLDEPPHPDRRGCRF